MYEKIPKELKELKQWVVWKYIPNKDKTKKDRKFPIDPKTGEAAKANVPETWGSFEAALSALKKYKVEGLGFEFGSETFGVDIDHCIAPNGIIKPFALEIVEGLESYTEISPSGTGIHIICRGSIPKGGNKKGDVEIYEQRRFFTVTGNTLKWNFPFNDSTEKIRPIHKKYILDEQKKDFPKAPPMLALPPLNVSDDELLRRAMGASNGAKFSDLYAGRWQNYTNDGSQSPADQAFCNLLAFWFGRDMTKMDAAFRRSGLFRAKWDEMRGNKTYGEITLENACNSCANVYEAGGQKPPPPPPPAPPAESVSTPQKQKEIYTFDDTGNARRFRDMFLNDCLYNHIDKEWLLWDGRRYCSDETGGIKRCADKMIDEMIFQQKELAQQEDDTAQAISKSLAKHITRTRSHRGKEAFLSEVCHLEGIPVLPCEMDKYGNAINLINCVLNLKKGTTIEHSRKFKLSKIAGTEFKEKAACPKWEGFLEDVTAGDKELILYLQRLCGYCLTASTREQCVFFLYGNGSNGKSTFIDVLSQIMGEYATTCQPETVMMRDKTSSARADIARLKGLRMVSTFEPNEGSRLDEGMIKQLTGGTDEITARFLYGKEFTFRPEFKIIMATNYKPKISGTDEGIWRRVRLIPFTVTISDDKKDKELPEKLKQELPGILNWCIKGATLWYEQGFPPCAAVDGAVKEYRKEMDKVQQFVEDCIVESPDNSLQASKIFLCYKNWCQSVGERFPMGNTKFYNELKKRYKWHKTASYNEYSDIDFTDAGLDFAESDGKKY